MLRLALVAASAVVSLASCGLDQPSSVETQASSRLEQCLRDEAGIDVSNVRFVIDDETIQSFEVGWGDRNPAEAAVQSAFNVCFRSVTVELGLNN